MIRVLSVSCAVVNVTVQPLFLQATPFSAEEIAFRLEYRFRRRIGGRYRVRSPGRRLGRLSFSQADRPPVRSVCKSAVRVRRARVRAVCVQRCGKMRVRCVCAGSESLF